MDLEQEVLRGNQAKDLLAHPLLAEAFAVLESTYVDAWINTPARDKEGKEELWKLIKNLRKVKKHLETVVETGKLAKKQVQPKNATNLYGMI